VSFYGFDLTADFKDANFLTEYHECGFRGECPMEELFADFQGKGHIITPLIFT
jgi:hypothetical protein